MIAALLLLLNDVAWACAGFLASRPAVCAWLIARAQRTPYKHILSLDGRDVYMGRWWLFNPYGKDANGNQLPARWSWLPSVRIHHIRRPDTDRHKHDHPWDARTIVLRNGYIEEREDGSIHGRMPGDTARLLFGEYHRIVSVPAEGAWTLFFTWACQGEWGYWVDGQKIPHGDYHRHLEQLDADPS